MIKLTLIKVFKFENKKTMAFRNRVEERRKNEYKKGIDIEDARRKRDDVSVMIRKQKRQEQLQKRRNVGSAGRQGTETKEIDSATAQKLQNLPEWMQMIGSNDAQAQIEATTQFRKLLSIEKNPPIQEVIHAGIVPRLVQFLSFHDHPQLQFEAAWALTNIASGSSEQTQIVIDHGAVPVFVQLLKSKEEDVREQAVWALGNIAGDSPRCRDYVLQHAAMTPLLQNLQQSSKLSMLRNATWTLSNFCRGKPQPPFELVAPALPTLARLIYSTDEEVLTDACWALSYLSDGSNDKIQSVIEAGVCRRLVELLIHPSFSVQTPALRTIGNIVTGDDIQTQIILNVSALPCLLSLLASPKKGIRKEACWTISNITAGNKAQIQCVIDANLVPPLIQILQNAEWDIKKEAAWALSNATSGGTPEQLRYLVRQGCIKPLCDLLACSDPRIIIVALEALENILKIGEMDSKGTGGSNTFADFVEEAEGIDKIEQLQTHQNNEIYEKAVKILELYFAAAEDDIQNVAPNAGGAQFAFNPNPGNNFNF